MTTEELKCICCGKAIPPGEFKKSIRFYTNWLEYLPGQWMCQECKRKIHDQHLIRYKLQFFPSLSSLKEQ
ncbi:MAG: hypothetical protein ACTSRS_19420 [Candidatus Helarchaeota archaeon]